MRTLKSLLQHRQELVANPMCYSCDLPRTVETLLPHLKVAGYTRMTARRGKSERTELVRHIFRAQGERPFFHIESTLPYCWNSPYRDNWRFNYIRYEWGHLRSINQNQGEAFHIENLCLMSARCNQHIQSSMNVEELLEYEGKLADVIRKNLAARQQLFSSAEWRDLLQRLEPFQEQ